MVGKGPTPSGRYTRANHGTPSSCWYSTSRTSTSNATVVAMPASVPSGCRRRGGQSGSMVCLRRPCSAGKPDGDADGDDDADQRRQPHAQLLQAGDVGPAGQYARIDQPGG